MAVLPAFKNNPQAQAWFNSLPKSQQDLVLSYSKEAPAKQIVGEKLRSGGRAGIYSPYFKDLQTKATKATALESQMRAAGLYDKFWSYGVKTPGLGQGAGELLMLAAPFALEAGGLLAAQTAATIPGQAAVSALTAAGVPASTISSIAASGGVAGLESAAAGLGTVGAGATAGAGIGTGLARLPPGGMTATGPVSASDAAMMGVGAPAEAGVGTGVGGAVSSLVGTAATGGASILDYITTGLGVASSLNQAFGGTGVNAAQQQQLVDPFAPYRAGYAQQLNQLMANPSSVTSLPGYQFLQQQGQQGVQRALAAQGRTVSGQEQLALQAQDQALANQFFGEQYNRLAQLSGAAQSPAEGGKANLTAQGYNIGQQQAGLQGLGSIVGQAGTPGTAASNVVGSLANAFGWR